MSFLLARHARFKRVDRDSRFLVLPAELKGSDWTVYTARTIHIAGLACGDVIVLRDQVRWVSPDESDMLLSVLWYRVRYYGKRQNRTRNEKAAFEIVRDMRAALPLLPAAAEVRA